MATPLDSSAWFNLEDQSVGNWESIVESPVVITSTGTFSFEINETVNIQLSASGDPTPNWSLVSGALPNGLSISTTGLLSGTLSGPVGLSTFELLAENGSGSDTQVFSVSVEAEGVGTVPSIVTTENFLTLLNGFISKQLVATGSPTPAWSLIAGSLPEGISLTATGALFGNARSAGDYVFTARAVNATGSATREFLLSVHQVPVITTTDLIKAVLGVPSVVRLEAIGFPTISWSVNSGSVPTGTVLGTDGRLFGTPQQEGNFSAIVTAINQAGVATREITISVSGTGGPNVNTTAASMFFAVF